MIDYLEITFLFFVGTFLFYVLIMELKVELEPTRYYPLFKYTLVPLFLIADWITNILISPIFLDPPATPFELVTARMKRYKREYSNRPGGYMNSIERIRVDFAYWLCNHLNRHDEGHC